MTNPGTAVAADRAADQSKRRTTLAAYTALAWAVVFTAFHIYWYLGGSFVSPGKLPSLTHHSLIEWILEVMVDGAFAFGILVPLAIARGWTGGRLAKPAAILIWVGAVILLLRGGSGIIDDLTRAAGVPTGISGISTEQATGRAYVTWSGWTIETYFLTGGIIFWILAVRYGSSKRTRATTPRAERGFHS